MTRTDADEVLSLTSGRRQMPLGHTHTHLPCVFLNKTVYVKRRCSVHRTHFHLNVMFVGVFLEENAVVWYSLLPGPGYELFSVNPYTGLITTASYLDRERRHGFALRGRDALTSPRSLAKLGGTPTGCTFACVFFPSLAVTASNYPVFAPYG